MPLRIEVLEPYDAVSHRLHWEGLQRFSAHDWRISSLPPRLWKFRMRTASIHFADQIGARDRAGESPPDLWVASEYLSVAEFLPLLPPRWRSVPVVVDFHENQLTYPLQPGEQRDHHFAFNHEHPPLMKSAAGISAMTGAAAANTSGRRQASRCVMNPPLDAPVR